MEKYNICFSNGWAIENQANVNKDIKLDKVEFELPFGESEFYKGWINWIYEPFSIQDEWIEFCKNIEAFNKRASFKVLLLKSEWEEIDSFEGSFIDALKYIQKEFNNG